MKNEPQELRMPGSRQARIGRNEALHRARNVVNDAIRSGTSRLEDAPDAPEATPTELPQPAPPQTPSMGSIPEIPQGESPINAREEAFADLPTLPNASSDPEGLTAELMQRITKQMHKLDEQREQLNALLERIQ